ncbi:MAG: tetratricopeptide repeat protein [Anaerolineae bacterium]|nr:tetratricopeptide repeat protein [Anaerolineae bacterium]
MKKKLISLVLLVALLVMANAVWAQDPTATPLPEEPLPNCPAFAGEPRESRTAYYMGEGLAYLNNNQLDAARISFSCIVRVIDANYAAGWIGRARVYTRMAEYERALADLNRAVQLAPDLAAAYNDRGYLFMQWHDYPRARADFNRALESDANYAPAYSNLAVLHTLLGEYDAAIELLEDKINTTNIDGILSQYRDPNRNTDDPILFNSDHARLYALLGIVYERQALTNFRNYVELYNGAGLFVDDRVGSAAGALESRFTFELRLDDGSWLLLSRFPDDAGL